MAISINWATKVITVPQADTVLVSGSLRELDVEDLRLWLKDIEDSEEGMSFPDTHQRNAPVTLSGTTYAQTFEIINGYTITFEPTGTPWTCRIVGGNHNIGDVKNVNHVSLIIGNSAGLIEVATGAGPTAEEVADAILNRDMAAVADTNPRSLLNAVRFLRNKWSIAGTTLTVTKEDDATPAWTAQVTSTPGAEPISGSDPA